MIEIFVYLFVSSLEFIIVFELFFFDLPHRFIAILRVRANTYTWHFWIFFINSSEKWRDFWLIATNLLIIFDHINADTLQKSHS